jgi:hypothetical protein
MKSPKGLTTFFLRHFLFLVLPSQFLPGCQPPKTAQPKPPTETYRSTSVTSERYLSTLNVPVDITTAEVTRQINTHLSGLLYEDDRLQDDDFACKVWKRAPIRVEAVADSFVVHVPLKVWAKFGYGFKPLGLNLSTYKETDFEVDVRFATGLTLAPDWTARTRTEWRGFDWVSKPNLRFGPVTVPIASIVGKILNKNRETITQGIDEAVRKHVDIRGHVVRAWNAALQPYLLSEKYRTWLKVTPTELQMTPLRTDGDRIRATVGIRAVTQTVFGERPAVKPVTDVPDLKLVPTVPDAFRVSLVAQLTHAEARRLLADTIVGRRFTFSENRYAVTVTDVDLYGSDDKLILKVGVTGSLNGTVYFRGVPYYDPSEKTIELRDLDYDLDTRSLLARTASWFLQGRISRQLQEAFRFPVGDQLTAARRHVQAIMQHRVLAKGVTLNGSLGEIKPEGVYLTPEYLLAAVFVEGRLTLTVDGL